MRCENNFCIYCDKYKCTLDEINIDTIGLCTECILIDLDDNTLSKQKHINLFSFEEDKNDNEIY